MSESDAMVMENRSASPPAPRRRLPVGAEVRVGGGVHFRVWAPRCGRVDVVLEEEGTGDGRDDQPREFALTAEADGYFSGHVPAAGADTRYRYRLDGGESYPDPASRFQPEGPHGPSQVVDPGTFAWTDDRWSGVR
ncbi:MAG TPA: hypothetical protein VF590_19505, partial [Isosphaeraceae bacterium]